MENPRVVFLYRNSYVKNIFKSKNYIYKIKTKIILNNKEKLITLIGRTNKHLITFDNKLININEIQDIKSIEKE